MDRCAAAEEKCFYAYLLSHDMTIEHARHSVAEHQELDERVESLDRLDRNDPSWIEHFEELRDRVLHHLDEEEHQVFQIAGKALEESSKRSLGTEYRKEMDERRH